MTEKLKVSREVAEALKKLSAEYTLDSALTLHVRHKNYWCNELDTLKVEQLATALIVGYEVETTPHEVIAKKYRGAKHGREIALEAGENDTALFNRGVMAGIKHTLRTLEITVEGVNDHDNS